MPVMNSSSAVGPAMMVYKLNGPWENLVPVGLNEEKTAVVSYPSPADLVRMKSPVKIRDEWWFDTRGITQNTAFLAINSSDYIKLKEAPSLADMMLNLKTKTPFLELWNCGIAKPGFNNEELISKKLKRSQPEGCTCLIKNSSH
jgi:hypothetical protein